MWGRQHDHRPKSWPNGRLAIIGAPLVLDGVKRCCMRRGTAPVLKQPGSHHDYPFRLVSFVSKS